MLRRNARKRAVHVMMVYTGGCNGCEIEIANALFSPYYDLEQYNVMLTFNPREADILIVTGPVTRRNEEQLKAIYERIPGPKAVIACGACAIAGGIYVNVFGELGPSDQIRGPLGKIIPVDASARGCAPMPEEIIKAVAQVIPKIMEAK
jgi:energy-converting hydrogenase B subunit M